MNHRAGSIIFGLVVGVGAAFLSYQWITNPERGQERAEQERVVLASRAILSTSLQLDELEMVDPLSPQRKVGKVYVYPVGSGWEVSGYYRRSESDRWHPYLLALGGDLSLVSLKVKDASPTVRQLAAEDTRLSAN